MSTSGGSRSGFAGLGPAFAEVGKYGYVAGAAVLAAIVYMLYQAMPVVDAMSMGVQGNFGAGGQADSGYKVAVARDVKAIDGRSLFFVPPAPPPPPLPPRPKPVEDDTPKGPPPPPPPPREYGGPKIMGAVAGYVWFEGGKKLEVGGEADGDLRVISVSEVPWAAKLEWKKVEFDVPFIPKDTIVKDAKGMKNMYVGSAPPVVEAPKPEKKDEKKDEKKEEKK